VLRFFEFHTLDPTRWPYIAPFCLAYLRSEKSSLSSSIGVMFVADRSIKRIIGPQSLLRLGGIMESTMEMRSTKMLMELEALAEKLGIQVIYERLPRSRSGLCRLYDTYMLFVERNLDEDEQVRIFVEALSRFHIDNIQTLPRIRHILQEYNAATQPQ
jgi:hypothetical protein